MSTLPPLPEFLAEIRRWIEVNIDTLAPFYRAAPETYEDRIAVGSRFLRVLYDAGWMRYGWPEAIGGFGGDARYRTAFYDTLWDTGYPPPEQHMTLEVIGSPLLHYNAPLAAELMPKYLSGEASLSQGFSEPEAGSDLAALRCRAVRDGDGPDADFVVNGQKIWTSNGYLSEQCILLVRTGTTESRHRGLSMLMVDMDTPGITRRPIAYANHHNELAEVFYDDVRVPSNRLLGEVNDGWGVAMYLLQFERGLYPWLRASRMLYRLELLREQLRERGLTDAWRAQELGHAFLAISALRARAARTVRRLSVGETIGPDSSGDKIMLANGEQLMLETARRVLGGQLQLEDSASARDWRSEWQFTRSASIYGGSAEVQRSIVADRVLRLPKD
ncbi:MAG TPA: acyl-CoA dehydrogenase family protein [Mycobacteriales bacterium]|nr:acyl-CoA dehydrogenase family protein [Mycobacteriales bacterium]